MKSLFEVTVRSKGCISTVQLVSDSYCNISKQINELFAGSYEITQVKRKTHDAKQASEYIETMLARLSLQEALEDNRKEVEKVASKTPYSVSEVFHELNRQS